MEQLSLIKGTNNLTHMISISKARHVTRMRVLRRPIVFLHVRCSIYVRFSILILLIKTVRCRIPQCKV